MSETKTAEDKKAKEAARKAKKRDQTRQYRARQAEKAATIVGTPVKDLELGQKIEVDGDLFVIKSEESGLINLNKLEWAPDGSCLIEKWRRPIAPDTLVIPRD